MRQLSSGEVFRCELQWGERESVSDHEILEKARAGDQRAYKLLFERYQPAVFRYCLTFGGVNRDTAMDIMQESFFRAFRNLHQLKEGQKFLSWLLTITRNRCLSHLSKEGNLSRKHQAWSEQRDVFQPVSTEEMQETERQLALVRESIESLPDGGTKDCVRGFYIDGFSTKELSERLQIPQSTITTRLDRFRSKIRKRLLSRLLNH